ncbi:MAG TPA: phosphatase PAP2 family protein [Flavipsychrobacter sp.]|nr:phosphatase PAP2 family protein [Flavipsychrobacter sp.]
MLARTRVHIRKLIASVGLLSIQLLLIIGLFILSLALFSFLVKQIFIDKQELFDFRVFELVSRFVTPFHTSSMQAITFLGTHKFLIPANLLLTAYFLLVRKHKWYSIKVAAIALSSTAMMLLLKNIFSRERPLVPLLKPALGYSFPSGHSMMSFAFYGLLIFLAYKYIQTRALKIATIAALIILIFLIGFSRVYLRVHYASDVLAGFAIGIVWLVFSLFILHKMERFSKVKLKPVVEEGVKEEKSMA